VRPAEEIRAELAAIEEEIRAKAGRDQAAFEDAADRELELVRELEETTVPVRRSDVDAAIRALNRWTRSSGTIVSSSLRETEERLRDALAS
jgi:hypothetical protein